VSAPIISVENLGKQYRLSHQVERHRYVALRDVIAEGAKRAFTLRRHRNFGQPRGTSPRSENFWALKDVSFEIQAGEVVGIIGRNGAGKSTVLKILSRITDPSAGRVRIRGRVGSLLEVGTGFHPELTGRENIYLNGAILGMKKSEIRRNFDEIVAFAEVEKFLDTPVKRYSSGMYVRLAFAVAAHLEPEILIVDEVLAVGDAEFQKKCLGKMEDVAREHGRTVLFVSHNMAAIKSLTSRAIVLDRGSAIFAGVTDSAIRTYVRSLAEVALDRTNPTWGRGVHTALRAARLTDADGNATKQYLPGEPLRIELELEIDGTPGLSLDFFLLDESRSRIGFGSTYHFHGRTLPSKKGTYLCRLEFEPMWLASGSYAFDVKTAVTNVNYDHDVDNAIQFEVPFSNPHGREFDFKQSFGRGALVLLSPRFQATPIHDAVAMPDSWQGQTITNGSSVTQLASSGPKV
jgi:lipopolysaccharide transport system ATP-binding protein